MVKKVKAFIAFILMASLLISSVCLAEMTMTGITKSFNPESGKLVLQTTSQTETIVYIPQTVKVYVKVKGKEIEIADAWKFLGDNLGHETKVTIERSGGVVTTLWVLEVPR